MKARFSQWFYKFILVGLLLLVAHTALAQGIQVRLGVSGMV